MHIEDLGSRNGILVNGSRVDGTQNLHSQDLITMGTTSFLVIDKEASQETIYSPSRVSPLIDLGKIASSSEEAPTENSLTETEEEKNWKDTFIPTRHLIIASIFSLAIFIGVISFLSLFRAQTVVVHHRDESKEIKEAIGHFSAVQFSFNPANGRIFLVGHVLTDVEHSELMYLIYNLPFISSVEDNVVVDEGVWSNINALLMKNPNWRGVSLTSKKAGSFTLQGYVNTEEEAVVLKDYINMNFPYLNLLDNQVVVENTLQTQLQNLLIEKGFLNVSFQISNGEVIFAGRVNTAQEDSFESLLDSIEKIRGVQQVKNFVIFTGASTARIDLSNQYTVSGTSRFGAVSEYVLINGKILTKGDSLDGMTITGITSDEVQLDKDGIKYKIDYNNQ
jgi:type III secretion system YscD/HrpQ family protein